MMFNRNIIPIILFISSSVISGYDFFITSQPGTFSEYFTSKNGVSCIDGVVYIMYMNEEKKDKRCVHINSYLFLTLRMHITYAHISYPRFIDKDKIWYDISK